MKSSLAIKLGKRIRLARNNMGMTQIKLSRKTGYKQAHISMIENGLKLPSLHTFIKLTRALQKPCDYFLAR